MPLIALLSLIPALTWGEIALPSGYQSQTVYQGLNSPTAMAVAPDGRVFVCQQGGEVRVFQNDSLLPYPFVTVSTHVDDEEGLIGIALDPDFGRNGRLCLNFTSPEPPYRQSIVRYTAQGNVAATGSGARIFLLDKPEIPYHLGGALFFGGDGRLFIATGEAGVHRRVQSLGNLYGKILRIGTDGSIPVDNPFYPVAQGANRAIWALGFRAPFTAAIQPGTGRIYAMDVGGNQFEEVDDINRGGNYGWPNAEGLDHSFRPQLPPFFTYSHGPNPGQGNSVCGGTFYPVSGGSFPYPYPGKFFFADYTLGWIRVLDPQSQDTAAYFAEHLSAPVGLGVGPDGSLYCLQRGKVTMDGGSGPGWGVGSLLRISYGRPAFTAQPEGFSGSVGEEARLRVEAYGKNPLVYQWQKKTKGMPGYRDIAGSTGAELKLAELGLQDDGGLYRCRVSNAMGADTSRPARVAVSRNQRPHAIIELPAPGSVYIAGTTLNFRGRGEDAEDGSLPSQAYTWWVDFHHDDHVHPFLPPASGMSTGSFSIPDTGETSDNVFYRIHLKVKDKAGLSHTASVDILPRKTRLALTSNPPGLTIDVDGRQFITPDTLLSVAGMKRNIRAISLQRHDGKWMVVAHQGGEFHGFTTPLQDAEIHTRFVPMPIYRQAFKWMEKGNDKLGRILDRDREWIANQIVPTSKDAG